MWLLSSSIDKLLLEPKQAFDLVVGEGVGTASILVFQVAQTRQVPTKTLVSWLGICFCEMKEPSSPLHISQPMPVWEQPARCLPCPSTPVCHLSPYALLPVVLLPKSFIWNPLPTAQDSPYLNT